jgi:hypothetical protein
MRACKSWLGLLASALIATDTGPMLAEPVEESHAGAIAADTPIRIWTAVLVDATPKSPCQEYRLTQVLPSPIRLSPRNDSSSPTNWEKSKYRCARAKARL